MKLKKGKLQITALAAAASILLTGAGVEPAKNNTETKSSTEISSSVELDTQKELNNLSIEIPTYTKANIIRNDLLIMRINNYIITHIKDLNNKDEKVQQVVELLTKLIENSKIEITSVTYKYNNNGTHTITTKYINKETKEEFTKTQVSDCTYEKNSNKCEVCGHVKRNSYTSSSSRPSYSHTHNFIKVQEEFISNNDETHKILTTFKCPSDNAVTTTTEIENCVFSEWIESEDKKTLISKCLDCGYTLTKPNTVEHVHNYIKINEEFISNDNGTHTINEIYECPDDKDTKTITNIQNCTFGEWKESEDKKTLISKCLDCGYTLTKPNTVEHIHNYIKIKEEIIYNNDDTHTIKEIYECPSDKKTKTITTTQNCTFGEIITDNIDGEIKQYQICSKCNGKKYIEEHIHSNPPSDLEYVYTGPNDDGTHNLEGTYTCTYCNELVTLTKAEPCEYKTTGYEIFSIYNSYNQHDRIDTCEICGYENKVREDCTKIGDLQYIKIYSTIYEYYSCELCKGYVDRKPHTEHTYGDWEINPDYHIRYCDCIEAREEGKHEYSFIQDPDNAYQQIATCDICGYEKKVLNHEHAQDEMDLWDLVMSPFYKDLVDKGQIANPNPSANDYCSRYDFICSTCGMHYSTYYSHDFKNGACTRTGYCGGIADPNYTQTAIEVNQNELIENEKTEIIKDNEVTYDTLQNAYNQLEENNYSKKLIKSH